MAEWLPHINAGLNALAALLLCVGLYFIRKGEIARHRGMMLAAAAVSAVFLVSYLAHRANAPILKFYGPESLKIPYYALLISHVGLSIAIVPLVAITLWRALARRFDPHRRIARYTWPAWMYVSVSGIFVYLMLYQLYPA
jgi:putative membrane protein